jgi:hypothetical protein
MLDRFVIDLTDAHRRELIQYCKMENVLLSSLVCAGKPKVTIELRLKTAVCHLLQRIDKWLNTMIGRLTADMEHCSRLQRRVL